MRAAALLLLLAAGACQGEERPIAPDEVHQIAWAAGREAFNEKAAAGAFDVDGIEVVLLEETAFEQPTVIEHREDGSIRVSYGAPAGPWIVVVLDPLGAVLSVDAKHANL